MDLSLILKYLPEIIGRILDGVKLLITGLFIRRSTKIEVKKNALEQETKIKDQQLEIAARPPANPSDVRDSLFRDGH